MEDEKFREWMEFKEKPKKTIQNRISNCRNVEKHEGDLDQHFAKDCGASLRERLSYSMEDERNDSPARHKIPINGNIRNGSATLKQAVRLYMTFKGSNFKPSENSTKKQIIVIEHFKKVIEHFKNWLIETEYKTDKTAYNYSRAINRISEHYSKTTNKKLDLYSIIDLSKLKNIKDLYGTSGKYSEFGNTGNGTNRAAINSLYRFRENTVNTKFPTANENENEIITDNYEKNLKKPIDRLIDSVATFVKYFKQFSDLHKKRTTKSKIAELFKEKKNMNEIICPGCKKAFKVDEAGFADILKQVRDHQFEIETIKENQTIENLKNKITTTEYSEYLKNELKNKLLREHSESVVEKVLEDFKIEVQPIYRQSPQNDSDNYSGTSKELELAKIHEKVPIGKYVRKTFNELIKNNLIGPREVERLQRHDYSKLTFDIQFPFLAKKILNTTNVKDIGKIHIT